MPQLENPSGDHIFDPNDPPSEEELKNRELARHSLALYDDIVAAVGIFADEHEPHDDRDTEGIRIYNLMKQFEETCQIDPAEVVRITIGHRKMREGDWDVVRQGEDEGYHIAIRFNDESSAHINVYGGLRKPKAAMDFETGVQYQAGKGHGNRTDKILSKPTQINLNSFAPHGEKMADCWLLVGPTANVAPKLYSLEAQGQYTNTYLRPPGLTLEDPNIGSYMTNQLLDHVNTLSKIERRMRAE